jgi:hypothetical protein
MIGPDGELMRAKAFALLDGLILMVRTQKLRKARLATAAQLAPVYARIEAVLAHIQADDLKSAEAALEESRQELADVLSIIRKMPRIG